MVQHTSEQEAHAFKSFGSFLRFLRRRARLTQRELAIAVNYSEGHICHLERDRRPPDLTTLVALFVPALNLESSPEDVAQLLSLAAAAHTGDASPPPEAPAAHAAPTEHHAPLAPLIGRVRQRAELRAQLLRPDVRLLTLIGAPGIGKTHLALQLAHDLRNDFADGVVVVELAPITQSELVLPTIARSLDCTVGTPEETFAQVVAALQQRRMLMVLDNMEQVASAALQIRRLLNAAPGLTILVTSRIALRLGIEHVVEVPPLAVPDLAHLPPLDELARIESMALLLNRLQAIRPDLSLTAQNALPLAAICMRVEGLPLAIELVASRARLFEPQELLTEVTQRFRQLRLRGRDVPPHHRTLNTALDWSYTQLSPPAQALFARLSVFVGSWNIDSVESVCDLDFIGRDRILDLMEELNEHSLIQRHPTEHGMRFSMLMMVRQFAEEQRAQRGEDTILMERLLEHMTELADRSEEQLVFGSEQAVWMARMEAEHDTIRAVLQWTQATNRWREGLRLASALWRFWYMCGRLQEGREWLELFINATSEQQTATRAHALDGLAILIWRQGEHQQAEQLLQQALQYYRDLQHPLGEARTLSHLGLVTETSGAYDQAFAFYEAALALHRAQNNSIGIASVLHNMGNLHCHQNNIEQAMALYNECLEIYEQHDSKSDIALISLGIGAVARDLGQAEVAHEAFARSRTLAEALGDEWTRGTALINLGDVAQDANNLSEAKQCYEQALAIFQKLGDQQMIAVTQASYARVVLALGDPPRAIEMLRQSLMLANALNHTDRVLNILEELAFSVSTSQPLLAAKLLAACEEARAQNKLPKALAEMSRYSDLCALIQQQLGAQWQQAWAQGRTIPLAQAVQLALTQVRPASEPR